jgi:hypothetical protein
LFNFLFWNCIVLVLTDNFFLIKRSFSFGLVSDQLLLRLLQIWLAECGWSLSTFLCRIRSLAQFLCWARLL